MREQVNVRLTMLAAQRPILSPEYPPPSDEYAFRRQLIGLGVVEKVHMLFCAPPCRRRALFHIVVVAETF